MRRKVKKYRVCIRPQYFYDKLMSLKDKGGYDKYKYVPKRNISTILEETDKWLRV